jgi:hypothetical protein
MSRLDTERHFQKPDLVKYFSFVFYIYDFLYKAERSFYPMRMSFLQAATSYFAVEILVLIKAVGSSVSLLIPKINKSI